MKQQGMKPRKQNFLEGALILITANIVIKLLGAVFKIPLKNLIGADGMGIYNTAYTPYAFLLSLATMGIPVAVSRMVAEANAMGRRGEVRHIFRVSLRICMIVGAAMGMILLIGAEPFVNAIPNTRALRAVMLFAPALFFATVVSAYRGYYQGMSDMIPTAASQLVEAVTRLAFGYAFARIAVRLGYSAEIAAAAAVFGVTLSTVCALLCLLIRKAAGGSVRTLSKKTKDSSNEITRRICRIALPITLASGVTSLTSFIDMFVIQNRLQTIGFTEAEASAQYGVYETMCVSMMNLPQTLIAAVTISLIPMAAASIARGETLRTHRIVDSALRLVSLMAFPCAVGLLTLSEPILALLFREDTAAAAPLLRILSFGTVFISFVSITNAILQAMGKERLSLYSMLSGAIVKLIVSYTLIGIPDIGIRGAPIGTAVCYAVILSINLILIARSPAVAPEKWSGFLKPALASALMGVFLHLCYPWLTAVLSGNAAVLLLIAGGAVIYVTALAAIHGIYREDILMLPKGDKIADIFKLTKENSE